MCVTDLRPGWYIRWRPRKGLMSRWDDERRQRAEKALEERADSGFPLWKPWALDLADDVLRLLGEKGELQILLDEAREHEGVVLELRRDESRPQERSGQKEPV